MTLDEEIRRIRIRVECAPFLMGILQLQISASVNNFPDICRVRADTRLFATYSGIIHLPFTSSINGYSER